MESVFMELPQKILTKVFFLQKNSHRIIMGFKIRDSARDVFNSLQILIQCKFCIYWKLNC